MSFEEEEESFEHTLLVVREVSIFKIPPRSTSGGYKCGEWLQSDKIWSGRLRVVSCKDRCEIRLEDPNSGDLFAACFVNPGQRENAVESVLDSSRYFVLKIEDGTGKHAFIGLGFAERNEAFDFNVALSDHEKHVKRENEKDFGETSDENHIDIHPAVNQRLKLKQKISSATSAIKSVFGQEETRSDAADKLQKLRERMIKVRELFRDAESTEFVIVTIPMVMAISESSRLRASLVKENVPVKRLIVNQVLPPSASDCKFCKMKRKDQMRALDMIESDPELSSLTLVKAPLVDVEIRGVPALQFLGDMVWK